MERTGRGRYETNLDDPDFTTMEDGTRFASFFLGDGEDQPVVFPMQVSADYQFPVHYHGTHYMSIILRGSLQVGKKWYYPGDIRLQEKGSVYGPERAGPHGCFMVNIFADRRGFAATLPGEPDREPPVIEPHIVLSKAWNALSDQAAEKLERDVRKRGAVPKATSQATNSDADPKTSMPITM